MLHVPVGPEFAGREVEFDVVLRPAMDDETKTTEWRAFVDATAGKLTDEFELPTPLPDREPAWD